MTTIVHSALMLLIILLVALVWFIVLKWLL